MKYTKLFTFVVASILTLSLCACGSSDDEEIIDETATVDKISDEEAKAIVDAYGYVSDNTNISLADSDFVGKWEITDLPVDELDTDFFGDDTVVISKDGTYQCGDVKAKLSQFWFTPGSKEKGAYKNTEELGYNSYSLQDYGELHCVFSADDGSQYPLVTAINVVWENEKHTEATLFMYNGYGSIVEIKKK